MRKGSLPPSRPFRFRCALGFLSPRLAYMLDSLVRVSRRVVRDLLAGVVRTTARATRRDERGAPLLAKTEPPSALPAAPRSPAPPRGSSS